MAGSSPSIAIKRDDFPLPTDPVMAIISPLLKDNEISFKAILSSDLSQDAETLTSVRSFVSAPRIVSLLKTDTNLAFSSLTFSCLTAVAISFRLKVRNPYGPR